MMKARIFRVTVALAGLAGTVIALGAPLKWCISIFD